MDARRILNGHKPSVVFDEYLAANPDSDKYQVARVFADLFPNVDSTCHQVIWNWRRPGMNDDKLDVILTDLLKKANYPVKAA
ncbi:hypothetical protein EWE75_24235 [Sphingomonas populi]|uniref:Uncharacterized protein n=1 Tax=Sphingomonas populi TaxID=2484750 RepID=A0A4Q6XHM4_9SPHN|nr:hypothetical protein [Sphingomonas populi]RZF58645.1 hypothetical protein EWE75_24235 [Sphingomonas populi]